MSRRHVLLSPRIFRKHEACFAFLFPPLTVLLLLVTPPTDAASEFNFEISRRVHERLTDYMSDPTTIARLISEYRINDGFPHGMGAPDRNAYLRLNDALTTLFPHFESIYYGLEDGVFVGHGFASRVANYREPGESGYDIATAETTGMIKYLKSCVDVAGESKECIMEPGGPYVECIDGCALARCDDEDSQRDCTALNDDKEREQCESKIKWCRQYVRRTATEKDRLGFVPRSTSCIDHTGVPSQESGEVMKKDTDVRGGCYYSDGVTPVERNLSGAYAYCGGDGAVCNDTFVGAFQVSDYDPRWRGWYEDCRASQRSNWSPPYTFFTTLAMGITYSEPIYMTDEEGRNIFSGVVAVDYTFDNITEFLVDNYGDGTTTVAVFEDAPPHYLIASSTGSKAVKKVLASDESRPCAEERNADCKAARASITSISQTPMDAMLSRSFARQVEESFPDSLVSAKAHDDVYSDTAYVSQTQLFELADADLAWRIIIMAPTELSSNDTITKGDTLFAFLIAVALFGFSVCVVLFFAFYKHRKTSAIIASDWRFTSAFIVGCSLLNTSSLSFLGPNTTPLCMLRMWLFHFFFAATLSPLLVKTYRMMKLIGGKVPRRVKISHFKAALYTLPIIVVQVVILTIFSVVDPRKQVESIDMNGADVSHRVICAHDTNAFFVTELIFEGGLVLLGCILAFQTRHLKGDFGESKQLIIAMYNIAVVGSVVVIIVNVMDSDQATKRVLVAMGILWGSVFSCCAFVVPRLLRVREIQRADSANDTGKETRVHVSGI